MFFPLLSGGPVARPLSHPISAVVAAALLGLSSAAAAADFPPITTEERALTLVASEPNAPAVVLFDRGELRMDAQGKLSGSVFTIRRRIKVLTEEGKRLGEIRLTHGHYARLHRLEGRTVLADGTVLELPPEDVFKRRRSRRDELTVIAAALPGVEVGAILDVEYVVHLESIFILQPWSFQDRIPTLLSEISYVVPAHIGVDEWSKTVQQKLEVEVVRHMHDRIVYARMRDMPSIPDEPFSFPVADVSSQFLLLPTRYVFDGSGSDLLVSWQRAIELYEGAYQDFRKDDKQAKERARTLAAGAGDDPRDRAAALYRFVRDEVALDPLTRLGLAKGASVDRVIADGDGSWIDQALVLQRMLEAVKIDADLLWVADRDDGRPDLRTPNPGWFSGAVVRAELGAETVYLDPSDPGLGFGQLRPDVEGMEALVVDRRHPEVVALPSAPFDQSVRRAAVALTLDDAGRLTGDGTLTLTGHHAWQVIDGEGSAEENAKEWQETLARWFDDFAVSEVTVEEAPDERRVAVAWKMAQPEEEVLGDESSISPSRPLGPVAQPFKAPKRRLPARFAFTDREVVELSVTWPSGWQLHATPPPWGFQNDTGAIVASVEVSEAERRLRYSRRFDRTQQEFITVEALEMIRQLYDQVEKNDAQSLVLVRR